MTDAIIFRLHAIIKSRVENGRRLVECEASNEFVDSEGDVILQKALLDSADSFVSNGHTDLDHISEIGSRIGIANPTSYIVGKPVEVKDMGKGRTSVVTEIMRSMDGKVDIQKNRYDEFWESLNRSPAVKWQASVYGYPKSGMVDDCSETECSHGATRYLIKGLDWRSLAFTRNPVNTSLTEPAKIITAKAYVDQVMKNYDYGYGVLADNALPPYAQPSLMKAPRNIDELWGQWHNHMSRSDCKMTDGMKSRALFKDHFTGCCGMDADSASIMAHALMMMIIDAGKQRR